MTEENKTECKNDDVQGEKKTCDCDCCKKMQMLGYADTVAWAKEYLEPFANTFVEGFKKSFEEVDKKRVVGSFSPEDADALKNLVCEAFIHQLLFLAARVAHTNQVSIGKFTGLAAEMWTDTVPSPFGRFIPIPLSDVKELLDNLMGDAGGPGFGIPDIFGKKPGKDGCN